MLVECGFVRVTTLEGVEYSFTPSFGRIAALGTPHEIVTLFAGLHGPNAAQDAAYVLACLSDQEDPTPLIGWREPGEQHDGEMPVNIRIELARHLMRHGIVGKARPDNAGDGKFSDHFDVAEYVSAARVHLGLSSADAEALSMTEFQSMFAMKFPKSGDVSGARDVPTREEYEAQMAAFEERRRGN